MYFEDEKDFGSIPDLEIDNSDSISWENILEDTDDTRPVSIKEPKKEPEPALKPAPKEPEPEVMKETPQHEEINSIDGISLDDVPSGSSDLDDDVDEEELMKILNSDSSSSSDDFDIDSQLAQVNLENASANSTYNKAAQAPKKKEEKKSSLVPALLFALLVVGGIWLYLNFGPGSGKNVLSFFKSSSASENLDEAFSEEETAGDLEGENTGDVNQQDIPVVNEENVSDIKAQETKEEEEKKEVISIVPTGRDNPFLPLSKYDIKPKIVTKNEIINNIDYDSINIPKPQFEIGNMSDVTTKLMSIIVSGVMYDAQKPSAIINYDGNDYFVRCGDRLDKFKVADIGRDFVKIALGANIYTAKVGEEFQIKEFFGVSPDINDPTGARQYYSSEDEFNQREGAPRTYTSSRDIRVDTRGRY